MAAPLILATGMMRSGSTWGFNVCRLIAQLIARQLKQPFASAYLTAPLVEEFVRTKLATLPGPTVLKAHWVGHLALGLVATGQIKCVSTYRDPRDCVASMLTFYLDEPFQKAMMHTTQLLEELSLYQQSKHTLLIRYEDMIKDTPGHVRKVADYLGVQIEDAGIAWIDSHTNIERAKSIAAALKTRPAEAVAYGTHLVDPATNLHDNHIYSGRIGRWREELGAEQREALNRQFEPWLRSLAYDLD